VRWVFVSIVPSAHPPAGGTTNLLLPPTALALAAGVSGRVLGTAPVETSEQT